MVEYTSRQYNASWPGLERVSPVEMMAGTDAPRLNYSGNKYPQGVIAAFMAKAVDLATSQFGQQPKKTRLVLLREMISVGRSTPLPYSNKHIEAPYDPRGVHALLTVAEWTGDDALPLGVNVYEGPVVYAGDRDIDTSRTTLYVAGNRQPVLMDTRTVHRAPSIEGISNTAPITRVIASALLEFPKPI